MFKSAHYNHRNIYGNAVHIIIDDDFNTLIELDREYGEICLLRSIITEYKIHKLPIAPNVALYYLWSVGRGKSLIKTLEYERKLIDSRCEHLQYGSKIYPCVVRQLKQRTWNRV